MQDSYLDVDQRAAFCQIAYSSVPAMAIHSMFLCRVRCYGTAIEFFDQTWKPDDVVKVS